MRRVTGIARPVDPGPAGWDAILPPGPRYPALSSALDADWLVIGAGFAGLSAARRLALHHPGVRIVLLEARRIAEGPVGRNSGFMIDLPHELASEDYAGSEEADRRRTALNRLAIDFAATAARDYAMDARTFLRRGKINAAATARGDRHNHDYAAHLRMLGEDYALYDATRMRAITGSEYYRSGLYTPGTAMLQPAAYARAMAAGLSEQGVMLHEDSPVTALERAGGAWRAVTACGYVAAPRVILAVNGHVEGFGHYRRRLMHLSLYASMTRPLTPEEDARLGGEALWSLTPADPMGTTVRKIESADGPRIVIRNGVTWTPSRRAVAGSVARMGADHDRAFHARFPMMSEVTMQHRWGGLLCLSRNAVPAFGEVGPGLFSACCQNGLGAARGTLSGMMAADLACGSGSEALDAFLAEPPPTRLPPAPLAAIGARAVLWWNTFRAGAER